MKENPTGESCANCVFSYDTGQSVKAQAPGISRAALTIPMLKCRRFPPFAFPVQVPAGGKVATPENPQGLAMGSMAVWPDVAGTQWCGEWQSEEIEPGLTGAEPGAKGAANGP